MPDEPIPDDVRDLIQRHIGSVAQLEALLFLRAHPSESFATATIASRLYASEAELDAALARLAEAGFLARENHLYRYECCDEKCMRVDRLAEVYSRHLILITNLIHAKSRNLRQLPRATEI